jgi:hypothetical protein
MKRIDTTPLRGVAAGGALLALIGVLSGCSSGGTRPLVTASPAPADPSRVYNQVDRLARPVVNEALAPVAGGRHKANNEISPSQDNTSLANDIQAFMTGTAGRSQQITDVVKAVLVPDVMVADLSQSGPAAYLGVETGGATGGRFGGRKLTDDVVDASLGVIFGATIPALGLAPDDGKEIPTLTSDNVGPQAKHFQGGFPYLGSPQ